MHISKHKILIYMDMLKFSWIFKYYEYNSIVLDIMMHLGFETYVKSNQ